MEQITGSHRLRLDPLPVRDYPPFQRGQWTYWVFTEFILPALEKPNTQTDIPYELLFSPKPAGIFRPLKPGPENR